MLFQYSKKNKMTKENKPESSLLLLMYSVLLADQKQYPIKTGVSYRKIEYNGINSIVVIWVD